MSRRPGEGDRRCPEMTERGTRCSNWEVEGLGACLLHVSEELLEEAEELTGMRRCRHGYGQPDSCKKYAVDGTEPPACTAHGANRGGVISLHATRRVFEANVADRLAAILAENGESLLRPPELADPLSELLDLAAEIKAGKEILRRVVAHLYSTDRIRYAHSKVGEQLRMEVLLYERGMERLARILIDISKLKIDERLAGIRQQTADAMERALDAALEDSGVTLEKKQSARQSFRKHLKIVA